MTPEKLQAWITAGSLLVNVLGMAVEKFAGLFKGSSVSKEERAAIYDGIAADAAVRAKRADEASGRA